MKKYISQFFKILLGQIIISATVVTVLLTQNINTNRGVFVVSLISLIPYFAWIVLCMVLFRKRISTKTNYYLVNITAWCLNTLLAVSLTSAIRFTKNKLYLLIFKKVYAYIFCPFKIFHFIGKLMGKSISMTVSAIGFSLVILVLVIVIPFLVKKDHNFL